MKRLALFIIILVAIGWGITLISQYYRPLGSITNSELMQISSDVFANDAYIPIVYTCNGQDVNPPLSFSGVSPDARSLALVIEDPDTPNGIYTHWAVYNIPPTTTNILQNSKPPGIVTKNSAGVAEYTGPCPTSGEHTYQFKLYALDSMLDSDVIANKTELLSAMTGHLLDQAQLLGKVSK